MTAPTISASDYRKDFAIVTTTDRQPAQSPSRRMVNAAAGEIYARWRPHVSEAEARAEAEAFARRFVMPIDGPLAPLPAEDCELEAQLAGVAAAMGA